MSGDGAAHQGGLAQGKTPWHQILPPGRGDRELGERRIIGEAARDFLVVSLMPVVLYSRQASAPYQPRSPPSTRPSPHRARAPSASSMTS